MAVDFEKLKKETLKKRGDSDYAAETRRLADLTEAITQRQLGNITEEQYMELAGQSYADTMLDQFAHELEGAKCRLQTKVDAGYLTPAEFAAICEKCFQPPAQ